MVAANAARSLSSSRCLATAPAAAALRDADCNISSQFHRVTYARKRSITALAIAHACVSSHKSLHRQRGRTFSRRGSFDNSFPAQFSYSSYRMRMKSISRAVLCSDKITV